MTKLEFIELESDRLLLRRFHLTDTPEVLKLAGEFEIADTTLRIPHPYFEHDALEWIEQQSKNENQNTELTWAISIKDTEELVGAIGLSNFSVEFEHIEMGYWIGKPFWGRGYATEAALVVLEFCFKKLKLNKVHAHHFSRNAASGKVLQKIGMQHEGKLRQHVKKWVKFEDIELYGILKSDINN